MQAQQTLIVGSTSRLPENKRETILWANLRVGWMNQKIETNLYGAFNPEHGASMIKPSAYYTLSDEWKAGILAVFLGGPSQSIFGRFSQNDQIEATLTYSW